MDLDTIVGAVNATSDLIADANQNELVDFTATGSAVNHVGITNAATGNGPTIEAKGDDTNIDLDIKPKGQGAILLKDGYGNELINTSRTASAVNQITVGNAATGNGPTILASGDDTNIDLNVSGKGTGALASTGAKLTSPKVITGVNDTNGNELVKVTATGSAVNEITVANAATGNDPTLSATGDDTNIHLKLSGKGSGGVSVGSILHAFLPVGMISTFGISTVPAGWLYCDGTTLGNASSGAANASDDYEALFDLIKNLWGNSGGTFSSGNTISLPNLKGAFLRGIDTGLINTRNKVGPTNVGDYQEDQFQGHMFGDVSSAYTSSSTTAPLKISDARRNKSPDAYNDNNHGVVDTQAGSYTDALVPISNQSNGDPRIGDDTRAYNAGIKYCIKF